MRVPRFFAADLPTEPDERLLLEGDEGVHLARVLRLRAGAEVEVFDGAGGAGRFLVEGVGRSDATLRLLRRLESPRELPFALTCAVAPPKGKRSQRLVEVLTELGVAAVAPLVVARSQGRLPTSEQLRRWALEAAKQCGRNHLPGALPPLDLAALIAAAADHELALLAEPRAPEPLRAVLPAAAPRSVLLAIGPEGGFTEEERIALAAAGLRPVRLGPTTLRIETAAAAVVAALVAAWA